MRRLLGVLALVPAVIALVVSYLWPTIWTVRASFNAVQVPFSHGSHGDTYSAVFSDFGSSLGYGLTLAIGPLLGVLVVAPVIAWGASRAPDLGRQAVRAVLSLALVTVAPSVVLLAWREAGWHTLLTDGRITYWVLSFTVATALATTALLSALRRRDSTGDGVRPAILVGVLAVLATIALALQAFSVPIFGAPAHWVHTTMGGIFQRTFIFDSVGQGAAAEVLLLVVLAVLGMVATAIVVFTKLRVETAGASPTSRRSPESLIAPIVGLAGILVVLLFTLWPWISALLGGEILMPQPPGARFGAAQTIFDTWAPSLPPALVGVLIAALAGYAIGALRPLGRNSEFLLLPFGPWLFVGVGLLLPHAFFTSGIWAGSRG